jgi:hypothetical protein
MRAVVLASLLLWPVASAWALPWPSGKGGSTPAGRGGIQAGVQRYKSMQQCIEELSAQLPVEAASQVLGTDPLEVVCASRQAAAKDDPEICRKEIKDYNQRSNCLRFFAIYTGRPQDCPSRGWPTYHEGLCSALASRQPSLCLAVPEAQQPLCRAVLISDGHCTAMASEKRASCRREAAAWRAVMKPQAAVLPAGFKPSMEVRASSAGSGLNLPAGATQFKPGLLAHGVLIADQAGSGDWFCIDRNFAPQEVYDYSGSPPLDIEIQVQVPSAGTGSVTIGGAGNGQAKVSFRETGSYRHRTLQASSGTVSLTKLSRSAGGQISGTFSIELTDGVDKMKLDGEFATFVRELVPLSSVSSYMRYRTGSSSPSSYSQGSLSPEEVKKYQAKIVKVKDGLYDVDSSVRDDILANTSKLTDSASISQDYGKKSFRLYSVTKTGLLGLLGFQDSDIIRKINGKAVTSREDFYDAYGKFKKAAQIIVVIERAGAETKMTYRIKKVAAKPAKKSE